MSCQALRINQASQERAQPPFGGPVSINFPGHLDNVSRPSTHPPWVHTPFIPSPLNPPLFLAELESSVHVVLLDFHVMEAKSFQFCTPVFQTTLLADWLVLPIVG